jgi:apolipoprotein N-acyltransferase
MPLAVVATLAFSIFTAMYYGLAGWLATRVVDRPTMARLLMIFPAAWVLGEWLRGWFLTGFPWLSLGYSQIDAPLTGLAPLLGVYGVSWALVFSAAALLAWRAWWPIVAAGCLWLAAAVVAGITWTQPGGDDFRVSIVQGNIAQHSKWRPEMLFPTLALYQELTDQAAASRLIIWPETAVPAFADTVEEQLLRPLENQMKARGQDILMGIPIREADGRYYNAIMNIGITGRDLYYKRHLVPFGEFMPLRAWLEPLAEMFAIPMSNFAAGRAERPVLRSVGQWVGMSICYEDAFGAAAIQALPQAGFMVNVSNDAWFGDSLAPHQHLQIARMRAAEGQRYLLRATNNGVSAIIDQSGGLVVTAPQFVQAVLSGTVQPRNGATPYARIGDAGPVLLSLVLLVGGLIASRFAR